MTVTAYATIDDAIAAYAERGFWLASCTDTAAQLRRDYWGIRPDDIVSIEVDECGQVKVIEHPPLPSRSPAPVAAR